MKSKILIAVSAIAIGLMGVAGDAEAAQGRKKSLVTGAVAGVAVGAAGAYMLNKMSNRGASAQEDERPTGSVRRAYRASDDDEDARPRKVSRRVVDEDEDERPRKVSRRVAREDDDEDERPVRRKNRPRGVDQTVTGSVGTRSESCLIRKVDLFDRKGNFVKNERMRVCQ